MTSYKRPTAHGAVCQHGQLARSCERCDDQEEIASLRAELRRKTEALKDLRRVAIDTAYKAPEQFGGFIKMAEFLMREIDRIASAALAAGTGTNTGEMVRTVEPQGSATGENPGGLKPSPPLIPPSPAAVGECPDCYGKGGHGGGGDKRPPGFETYGWAVCNRCSGTGKAMGRYIGTVQQDPFVWHVYEVTA